LEIQEQENLSALLARCAATPTAAAAEWTRLAEYLTPRLRGAVTGALTRCRTSFRGELVEELVQEVWCRLLAADRRALRDYRGGCGKEASAYLRRIAATVVYDRLRAERAGKRRPVRLLALESPLLDSDRMADRSGCPERRLLAREQLRGLERLCVELVAGRRRRERLIVARLALVEGSSSGEIVARLGAPWTVGRVNSFLFRLRRRLEAHGVRLAVRARGTAA
jgi:DNA-directed RNA polymerase specialized sigma24 family protein